MLSREELVNMKTSVLSLEMKDNHCDSLPVTNEKSFTLLLEK